MKAGIGTNNADEKIGIGSDVPTKDIHIVGFGKFDTLLIRVAVYIFRKRNLTISVTMKKDHIDPAMLLFVDGNIGIGT